ncbi:MAG: FeoB-associated Cys-rich membrane protein [Syntrophales bacterium]|jgi:hypothetical protein|nr:FeoB-associated Cys-rich membrane protein [Syntrophales bacterium]MDY0045257.1 FeoB-associated Cys-rich membrane protein [Syntrophales bacterium]
MPEFLIVGGIVALVVVMAARSLYRIFTGKNGCCGCAGDCLDCPSKELSKSNGDTAPIDKNR